MSWQREWRESTPGGLPRKFRTVVRELVNAGLEVEQLVEQRRREWELEQQRREEQQRNWRRQELERKRQEALTAARDQLLAIVEQWALARNIEQFFADVEQRAAQLTQEERQTVLQRLQSAREIIGATEALQRFAAWVSPDSLLDDRTTKGGS